MRTCSSPLASPELNRLRRGTTCLTVPLVDGVVQVGIGGDFATTTLAVLVTATAVRIRRLDGRRLQVHIVENWTGPTAPGTATAVFDEPVDVVVLERCAGRWVAGTGADAADRASLERFVGTLTRFALAKDRGRVDQEAGAA
ncbi:hypothetical protein A5740_13155 [Mycobacterium sp. GA-1841]|uniref:hypothetical protein n=1 Tax=Mycobacterium sp. GA-1841 TaxID=1834154 RepID=UPI00097B10CF|nr:hypothetical protein [Mycobacterium sp. GA-1841]OMC32365.1 hypothetical protein A5740_13155 [Mycobacterium sp. GA-1841]